MPTLTFKVSQEEARQIRALARQQKLSVPEFLRRQAKRRPREHGKIKRAVCTSTGATIFAAGPELPSLNTETVRGLLTGFP